MVFVYIYIDIYTDIVYIYVDIIRIIFVTLQVKIMKTKYKKLLREQLDATLKRFEPFKTVVPPQKGWIRAIRDALGMTGEQLSDRL